MGYEAGFNACVLDGYTFEVNPSPGMVTMPEFKKDTVYVKTLTGGIIYHWDVLEIGSLMTMEWTYMPNTMRVALQAKYKANYLSYAFKDWQNRDYTVIMTNFNASPVDNPVDTHYTAKLELMIETVV